MVIANPCSTTALSRERAYTNAVLRRTILYGQAERDKYQARCLVWMNQNYLLRLFFE